MDLKGDSMEEIIADANSKGFFAVDQDQKKQEAIYDEWEAVCEEVTELCNVEDPVETPYFSKYKAREKLDAIVNKLDATKAIASLEKRREQIAQLSWRIASCRVKLGTISWECDEPHNAQTDLELAANYFSPDYTNDVDMLVGEEPDDEAEVAKRNADPEFIKSLIPPMINLPEAAKVVDAMKCMNMLGILWAGRGLVPKSLVYLNASQKLYKDYIDSARVKDDKKEVESCYTHNLFYLAQAYGHLGDSAKSSEHCLETLKRQLANGFGLGEGKTDALDWVKNCVGFSDFFLAVGQLKKASVTLLSARKVLELQRKPEQNKAWDEQMADLTRRLANLDLIILKRGFELALALQEAKQYAEQGEGEIAKEMLEAAMQAANTEVQEEEHIENIHAAATAEARKKRKAAEDSGEADATVFTAAASAAAKATELEFFPGLVITVAPYMVAGDVNDFDDAKAVFGRANTRLEQAKKVYVMDGFVSDHVALVQQQSKLYHYLATFEVEVKRRLAMETRRTTMLMPLLQTLSRASFEGLHKQLSFEAGEAFLVLLDIKIEKFRGKNPYGTVDPRTLKAAEITNCNNYVRSGLAMFTHYISFFAPVHLPDGSENPMTRGGANFAEKTMNELAYLANAPPDEETISADEVRAFLNAHFLSARFLSRVIIPAETPQSQRATYMVACLKRYEMLKAYTEVICAKKNLDAKSVFGEELQICKDMVNLLPAKIDRMMRFNENPIL